MPETIKVISAHVATKDGKDQPGWYAAFGIWFAGSFRAAVEAKHAPRTWAYLDINPEELEDGCQYPVDVWGKPGVLIYWVAQGFPRGAVISVDEPALLEEACGLATSKPWSFEPIFALGKGKDKREDS
jgi:hypothetical protein